MKESRGWIDERAPKHLSTKVLSGALYIHTGKNVQEKIERSEQVLKKIGAELAGYAMALLILPQMMDMMRDSKEYQEFKAQRQSTTFH